MRRSSVSLRAGHDDRTANGDGGFAAGAEALVFGVLIFVIGTLLAVNAWAVIDAKFATSAAAREAVRAVVESAPGTDLQQRAEEVARTTIEGHGRDPDGLEVTAIGTPALERCAEIAYRAEIAVPAIALPGDWGVGAFRVASQHRELVEPYRAGLAVDDEAGATCVF